METKRDKIVKLYKRYMLDAEDVYKHNHYTIITRSGIEKIQAFENIKIDYDVITCEPSFATIKATASKEEATIQTFGSALHGTGGSGNCTSWYVAEMAEKRAMSRAVLKLTGMYELDVFGADESEEFIKK